MEAVCGIDDVIRRAGGIAGRRRHAAGIEEETGEW